jgi:hypothetical protein
MPKHKAEQWQRSFERSHLKIENHLSTMAEEEAGDNEDINELAAFLREQFENDALEAAFIANLRCTTGLSMIQTQLGNRSRSV